MLRPMLLVMGLALCGGCGSEKKASPPPEPDESAEAPTAGAKPERPTLDRSDPEAVARAALNAYKRQDLTALFDLVEPDLAIQLRREVKPGAPSHDRMFDPQQWRFREVSEWEGGLSAARIKGERARLRFGEMPGGQLALVELEKIGGRWHYAKLQRSTKASFEVWASDDACEQLQARCVAAIGESACAQMMHGMSHKPRACKALLSNEEALRSSLARMKKAATKP